MSYLSKLKLGQRALVVVALGGGLLVFFQNCGKAGFDGTSLEDDINPNGLSAIESGVPFAFKATFDTIAYNSCFGNTLPSRPPFFTVRGGAYTAGGVKVTREFFNYTKSKLKPTYPNPKLTAGQYKDLLGESPKNKNAQIQYSIRKLENLKSSEGIYRTGNVPLVGFDFFNLLGPLTDERWSDPLITSFVNTEGDPNFSPYFGLGPRGYRNLEVSHSWNSDENIAQLVRNALRSDAVIALTYQPPDGASGEAMSPGKDVSQVYGTGYVLGFGLDLPPYLESCVPVVDTEPTSLNYGKYIRGCGPRYANPGPHPQNPDNALTAIQEIDLATGAASEASWSCMKRMRFLVVRPSDQDTICPKGEDFSSGVSAAEGYYDDLELVRRMLPADQWDVNLTRRCAVPKDGDCYSQERLNDKLVRVQYDSTKVCYQGLPGISYTPQLPEEICSQFISICSRQ